MIFASASPHLFNFLSKFLTLNWFIFLKEPPKFLKITVNNLFNFNKLNEK